MDHQSQGKLLPGTARLIIALRDLDGGGRTGGDVEPDDSRIVRVADGRSERSRTDARAENDITAHHTVGVGKSDAAIRADAGGGGVKVRIQVLIVDGE